MSGGTPDAAGSGGFWGCTEAACTGLFKKKKKKVFIAVCTVLVIRRGWLQGSVQLLQASAGRRHESWTARALGSGRWRCSAPCHETRGSPAPWGSRVWSICPVWEC